MHHRLRYVNILYLVPHLSNGIWLLFKLKKWKKILSPGSKASCSKTASIPEGLVLRRKHRLSLSILARWRPSYETMSLQRLISENLRRDLSRGSPGQIREIFVNVLMLTNSPLSFRWEDVACPFIWLHANIYRIIGVVLCGRENRPPKISQSGLAIFRIGWRNPR